MNKIIITSIILLSIFACNSKKQQVNNNPLVIQNAFYQNWYGGREGVSGISIEINAKQSVKKCTYQTIYYLDKKAEIDTKQNDENFILKANINTSTRRDQMLSSERNEEYGNQVPVKLKYPNLNKNEAIIEYLQKDKLKHFKVVLIKKEALYYP